ncbi:hypothetical protein BJ170DRAFT_317065 [Xylariales sp. AK1849]|nr:hypothetical protein BJ170DRAFT_317065 [Xylariales sp. AK1849]
MFPSGDTSSPQVTGAKSNDNDLSQSSGDETVERPKIVYDKATLYPHLYGHIADTIIKNLTAENLALKQELDDKLRTKHQHNKLTVNYTLLAAEKGQLEQTALKRQVKIRELEGELSALRKDDWVLRMETLTLAQRVDAESKAATARISSLETTNVVLNQQLEQLSKLIRTQRLYLFDLNRHRLQRKAWMRAKKREIRSLRKKYDSLETDQRQTLMDRKADKAQREEIEEQFATMKYQHDTEIRNVTGLSAEIDRLLQQAGKGEREREALVSEAEGLRSALENALVMNEQRSKMLCDLVAKISTPAEFLGLLRRRDVAHPASLDNGTPTSAEE